MEPTARFTLPDSTPRSSKTTINIAGFHVYLFGIDELSAAQASNTTVLFHVHGRTRTYSDAEQIAHFVLNEWRSRGSQSKGLVIATFDNRNHGARSIDQISIQDWKAGNETHAQDMLSTMDGIVADIQTVIKFLGCYVEGKMTPKEYIITGLSLGGHVTWDVLAKFPEVHAGISIVGSPSLTPLLVQRLGYQSASTVPAGTKEWPKSIEKLYLARDEAIKTISGKKILILTGEIDQLVPSRFTYPLIDGLKANNDAVFVEEGKTGHWLSWNMMDRIVQWILETVV